jgi:hypothetical protein
MKPILLLVTVLVVLGVPALAPAGPKEDATAATQAWADVFNSRDQYQLVHHIWAMPHLRAAKPLKCTMEKERRDGEHSD